MVVTDKQADIAILKTLGAKPRTIMLSFVFQGMIIGWLALFEVGIWGGASNAYFLAFYLAATTLHVQLISEQVYGVSYLPSKLSAMML